MIYTFFFDNIGESAKWVCYWWEKMLEVKMITSGISCNKGNEMKWIVCLI